VKTGTRSIVVGTAGHIDHGKSSLVLALTGTDPDRLKEEKARGITIDLGFAHFAVGEFNFAFVDVPGHERFVRNMLAGAGGMDAVLLVVAADESVMPQTREHFEICRLLHVRNGLVALTKADLVDEESLQLCTMEVRELVEGSFLEGAPIVAVSSRTGAGLDQLRGELTQMAANTPSRSSDGVVRLPVDRAFSMRGFGTVVTGTLVSGRVQKDDSLTLMPAGRPVKVRGLQVHGDVVESAAAGQRTAVNIAGLEVADIARGDVLSSAGTFEATRRADVQLEMLEGPRPLKHGARVRFHQGTSELLGRIALAEDRRFARIRFEKPAILTRGDRFILRAYSPPVTIGGGTVLDPQPPRIGVRTPSAQARFRRLAADASPTSAVLAFIEEGGVPGLPEAALVSRAGLTPSSAAAVARELRATNQVTQVATYLVSTAVLRTSAESLMKAVGAYHAAQPLASGLPRREAREKLFGRAPVEVFEHVIQTLERAKRLVARDTLAAAGRTMSLSDDEARANEALQAAFRSSGLAPPDPRTAAATAGLDVAVSERIVNLLVREKVLVRLDQLLFHADALARLKSDVQARKAAGDTRLDVTVFKERYGVTRKFAIPLLEYLDRERITRRVGDARVVL
jgi:selenocysteine-specific elongation factor